MPELVTATGPLAYTDTGAPPGQPHAPAVVFGHGLLFGGWMFRAQVAALRERYRCVTVDWRGQGDTPPGAPGGYDIDVLYADAAAVIEQLGLGAVHWVGLSMGGFVGMRLAARRPDLIRSLVLLDTSAEPEPPWSRVQDTAMALAYPWVGIGPLRRPVERLMFGATFRRDPAGRTVIDEWARRLAGGDRRGIRGAVLAVAGRRGVTDELRSVTAPTLVATGAEDVPTPPARGRAIAASIRGARFELVPRAGHSSAVEQPAAVTALIAGFLAEVDAADRS